MVEDTKESLFRAEVQNRVYKRQIEAIDAEIRRLENAIAYSPSNHQLNGSGGGGASDGLHKEGNKVRVNNFETLIERKMPIFHIPLYPLKVGRID